MMDIADALEIVLDLAKQSIISNCATKKENDRHMEAIGIVEDMAVNQFGDD